MVKGRFGKGKEMRDIELFSDKYDWILSLVAGICTSFILLAGIISSFNHIKEDWEILLMLTFVSLVNFYNSYRQYKGSRNKKVQES